MWKKSKKRNRDIMGIKARKPRKIEDQKGMIVNRKIIRIVVMVRGIGQGGSIIKEIMISIWEIGREKKEKGQRVL